MPPVERPIFLVGSERSGTTLLRLMLDHHPGIAFNGESDYIVSEISDQGAYPEISRYCASLATDRIFQGSCYRIDEHLDYAGMVNDFLDQIRTRANKEMVGATVHHRFRLLRRIWPKARFIYLYRDGRDVATSVVRMGWAGNVYVAADWWLNAEREWDELRDALPQDAWIEVRFEDLIASARQQLERICVFLGVPYSAKMLDYVADSTYSAPDPGASYQWKTGLRAADVQRIEAKLADRLLRRGYAMSGLPRKSIGRAARTYLRLHSRGNAYLFRVRRF